MALFSRKMRQLEQEERAEREAAVREGRPPQDVPEVSAEEAVPYLFGGSGGDVAGADGVISR